MVVAAVAEVAWAVGVLVLAERVLLVFGWVEWLALAWLVIGKLGL